jgi:hypothetical protein
LQVTEQRAPLQLPRYPNIYACVGSAISAGESHIEAARRLADIEGRPVVTKQEATGCVAQDVPADSMLLGFSLDEADRADSQMRRYPPQICL